MESRRNPLAHTKMYKQEGCLQNTPSVPSGLHHTGKASTGNVLCAVPAQGNSGKTWTKVRATKGGHRESQRSHNVTWEDRNGVLGLENVIRSDMINLHASKRLLQAGEEQMFSLSVMGRKGRRCKLW